MVNKYVNKYGMFEYYQSSVHVAELLSTLLINNNIVRNKTKNNNKIIIHIMKTVNAAENNGHRHRKHV